MDAEPESSMDGKNISPPIWFCSPRIQMGKNDANVHHWGYTSAQPEEEKMIVLDWVSEKIELYTIYISHRDKITTKIGSILE